MKKGRVWLTSALVLIVLGCGSEDGSGASLSATSELCEDVRGHEAVYYGFINGVPRGNLPSTAFTIPFDIDFAQSPYSNPTSLLLGFSVPVGWTVSDGADVSGFAIPGTVAAANLVRNDDQAVWPYILNAQVTGNPPRLRFATRRLRSRRTSLATPSRPTSSANSTTSETESSASNPLRLKCCAPEISQSTRAPR